MRSVPFLAAVFLLLVLTTTLHPQGSTSTKPVPPKEILGKSVKEWVKEMTDKDPAVKVKAIQIMTNFGESARGEAGKALIGRLNDTDASVRVNAAMAIQAIGLDEKDVAEAVQTIQRRFAVETQAFVRYHLTMLAAQIGPPCRVILNDLAQKAKDPGSYEIRKAAVYALGQIGMAADREFADSRAVAALIELFASGSKDISAEVRLEAVVALSGIGNVNGNDRSRIISAFKSATGDKEKTVAIWANVGLMTYDKMDDKYMTGVTKNLKANEPYNLRLQATRALGVMGSKSKGEVTELIDCLSDKEPLFVAVVAWSLGQIGDDAEKAVPALEQIEKSKDANETVKTAAKDALSKITGKKRD
jgi:HEAT repeat protein